VNRTQRNVVTTIIVAVVVIVVVNVIARGLDDAVGGSQPGGNPGSSYTTSGDGLAAYAQLLAKYGHPVRQQRGRLADVSLDPSATLILSEANQAAPLEDDEIATVRNFLQSGGRAVLAQVSRRDVAAITGITPDQRVGSRAYHHFDPSLGPLRTVTSDAARAYGQGSDLAVLASEGRRVLLGSTRVDAGEALLLADATPITNGAIGDADNAAFGLALPGSTDRPVVFAEGVHGYGEKRGLAALPDRWKIALVAFGLAAVVYAWARGRRLGPPDRPARELPPARSVYVDAMADTLLQTPDRPRALAPLGDWARERVRQHAGLSPEASREEVSAAARQLGLSDEEIATLWRPPGNDDEILALGRVVTRVTDERT
jgi:Domain of unknown function (DUF4350)